jgi:hypothetical protein
MKERGFVVAVIEIGLGVDAYPLELDFDGKENQPGWGARCGVCGHECVAREVETGNGETFLDFKNEQAIVSANCEHLYDTSLVSGPGYFVVMFYFGKVVEE